MDPDAALKELLDLAQQLFDGDFSEDDIERMSELVLALDKWIADGGALPERWERGLK